MIFNDGQAFKNMEGDLRAPNVLDNLIYRREIPVPAQRGATAPQLWHTNWLLAALTIWLVS